MQTNQRRFDFRQSQKKSPAEPEWAEIIAADPIRYRSSLMQRAAAMALHRSGKAHASDRCPLCQRESAV
jgi:hypothetical protein